MKNINIIFSLILFLGLTITSCDESTIEVDPIGDTEAGFYQNEEQMTMAVLAVYQKMGFYYTFHGQSWLTGIWLLPGDNLSTQGWESYENFVGLNASDGRLSNFYKYAYQLIGRANVVLEKIEENSDVAYKIQPELKDYHRGEALFLRAWTYFRLWNIYGSAAPLVTERITNLDNAYPPSSTGTQLLDQAITDLKEASALLPQEWPDEEKGRVTKNSALGMAAKVLVFRGTVSNQQADFSDAISQINQMEGVDLAPNYGDNFNVNTENNVESLLEYQANEQSGMNNPYLNNDDFAVVGDLSAYYGYYTNSPGWIGTGVYTATEVFKEALEVGDPRIKYIIDMTPGSMTNVLKYNRDGSRTGGMGGYWDCNRNNTRILRYADILLLKAEALVRSGGNTTEAIGLINRIRERARKSTEDDTEAMVPANLDANETDPATILEWIFQEKRVELCFEEGNRWFDLRRRHIAGEIDLTQWNFSSYKPDFSFEDYNIYFPLPESEIIQNSNLIQNEGY